MRTHRTLVLMVILMAGLSLSLCGGVPALAEEEQGEGKEKEEKHAEPSDLTFSNFFSAGWRETFEERSLEGRAVRVPLFRTRLGFLEREVRGFYRFAQNTDQGTADEHEMELEADLPLNRRFMVELSPEYTWINGKDEPGRDAPSWTARGVLQLVDTHNSAMNVQLSVGSPLKAGGEDTPTSIGVVMAGYLDLGQRFGLQGHVAEESLAGAHDAAEAPTELNYAVALTKTLTEKVPWFSNVTPSIEVFAATPLGGESSGRTTVSLVPGVQWELGKNWWWGAGLEVPVTGPHPFDEVVHVTAYKEF